MFHYRLILVRTADVYPHELQADVCDLLFERQYDEAINLLNEKLGLVNHYI